MSDITRRQALGLMGGFGATLAMPGLTLAQSYPTKPITMIVGFAPGGLTDVLARLVAPLMAEKLGQKVLVENRPGAAGNIATAAVANAKPDGHTLLFTSAGPIIYNPHTYETLPADPLTQLAPITMVADGPLFVTVNSKTGIKTVDELIAYAKAKPGALNYATSGAGGNMHVVLEMFRGHVREPITPVHYQGTSALIPDLLANQVQFFADSASSIVEHVKAGTLRVIMATGRERHPAFPDAPSAAELGYDDLAAIKNWFGVFAPTGTPDGIVKRLHEVLREAVGNDVIQSRLADAGMRGVASSPTDFAKEIAESSPVIAAATKAARIRVE
jgi:tripartite-type tricarboxylate transporter receptor subunit TctC